jgi:hypothetical protein
MRRASLIVISIAIGLLMGCGKKGPESVAGNYVGAYFGGTEQLTLTEDGKFTQSFSVNGEALYTNEGTWMVDGRNVQFRNFIKAYWFTDEAFSEFRTPLDEFNARIPVGANAIVFSGDGDYFVRKQ